MAAPCTAAAHQHGNWRLQHQLLPGVIINSSGACRTAGAAAVVVGAGPEAGVPLGGSQSDPLLPPPPHTLPD